VCECFSAILNRADVGSDLEVNDLVMCLERVCLSVSTAGRDWGIDVQP
jgi:hypothetical protein